MFRKLDMFPTSGEGWETPIRSDSLQRANPVRLLALSKGPNRVGITHPLT
jgi:hypothetical protein